MRYLVMDLVLGCSLQEQLAAERDGHQLPWSPRQALGLASQPLPALGYIHSHGVLHRDLKPSNVLLQSDPHDLTKTGLGHWAFIADFGLATLHAADEDGPAAADWGGTPAYMAPEQRQHRPAGPRADQYPLGLVAHPRLREFRRFCVALVAAYLGESPGDAAYARFRVEEALAETESERVPGGGEPWDERPGDG